MRISDWSSDVCSSDLAIYGAAGLAAPAPEDAWLATKAKGFAVGGGALLATWGATEGLKTATGRERPIGRADDSFPSNHASITAAGARLARATLLSHALPPAAARKRLVSGTSVSIRLDPGRSRSQKKKKKQ